MIKIAEIYVGLSVPGLRSYIIYCDVHASEKAERKRWVFNRDLKHSNVGELRIVTGSLFQSLGAAIEKVRPP